jgi:hypothetical protein
MLVGAFGQIPQTVLGLLVATRAPSAILEIALKRFDPCQSDELGRTPLMVSAIAGDLNAAKLLYSRSDTSARDTQGSTAYEYALAMNVDGVRADVFSFFEAMEIGDAAPIAAPAQRTRLRM